MADFGEAPSLPIPVSYISGHYLLFDIQAVSYLRTVHAIQGLQIGTLPQVPQQNTFRGLPVELMAAEVSVLLEKGVAVVVDDLARHEMGVLGGRLEKRKKFLEKQSQVKDSESITKEHHEENHEEENLGKATDEEPAQPQDLESGSESESDSFTSAQSEDGIQTPNDQADTDPISKDEESTPEHDLPLPPTEKLFFTPSITQSALLSTDPTTIIPNDCLPLSTSAIAFISHLSKSGYTVGPGMQYGAEYVAYPGPPEATHSQLLVKPVDPTDQFSINDLTGITRLGNSVQKIYTVGGLVDKGAATGEKELAVFTFEWAGF